MYKKNIFISLCSLSMLLTACTPGIKEFGKPTITQQKHDNQRSESPAFIGPTIPEHLDTEINASTDRKSSNEFVNPSDIKQSDQALSPEEQKTKDIQTITLLIDKGIRAFIEVSYLDKQYQGLPEHLELFTDSFIEMELNPNALLNKRNVIGKKITRKVMSVQPQLNTLSYSSHRITVNAIYSEEGSELGHPFKAKKESTIYFKKDGDSWLISRIETIRSL